VELTWLAVETYVSRQPAGRPASQPASQPIILRIDPCVVFVFFFRALSVGYANLCCFK